MPDETPIPGGSTKSPSASSRGTASPATPAPAGPIIIGAAEPVLVPLAAPGKAGSKGGAGGDPTARLCPFCGTSAPPDDTFCTNCGRPLPAIAETRPSRRWSRGSAGDAPAGDAPARRRVAVLAFGIAVVAVIVVAAGVAVLAQPKPTVTPLPTAPAATPFAGDGYSVVVPTAYSWVYLKTSDGDQWHVQPVGGSAKGIEVTVVSDLAPAEQTLEGALGRMESRLPTLRRPVVGTPQRMTLPAGPAYRVVDSGGIDTYVFFKGGRAVLVAFHNLTRAEEDTVATSVTLR